MIDCHEGILLEFAERSDSRVIQVELSSSWNDGFRDVTPGQLWLEGRGEEALTKAKESLLRESWARVEKEQDKGPKAFSLWLLKKTLSECGGVQTKAAQKLGVLRQCVNRWASEVGFSGPAEQDKGPKTFSLGLLRETLSECGGVQIKAAQKLGVSTSCLNRWALESGLGTKEATPRAFTRERLVEVLTACDGNQSEAGRRLNVPQNTINRWAKAWGLPRRTSQRRAA